MLRTRSNATLVAALLFAVLGGAQCPERKVQCLTDSACSGDEVCTDGICGSDDRGGEGEGEAGDLPTAITAFCTHVTECGKAPEDQRACEDTFDDEIAYLDAAGSVCDETRAALAAFLFCAAEDESCVQETPVDCQDEGETYNALKAPGTPCGDAN